MFKTYNLETLQSLICPVLGGVQERVSDVTLSDTNKSTHKQHVRNKHCLQLN